MKDGTTPDKFILVEPRLSRKYQRRNLVKTGNAVNIIYYID